MSFQGEKGGEVSLWNDEEGFYFDAISWGPGASKELPIRSLVGLIPLYATLTLEPSAINKLPGFKKRMDWFIKNRSSISRRNIANMSGSFVPFDSLAMLPAPLAYSLSTSFFAVSRRKGRSKAASVCE